MPTSALRRFQSAWKGIRDSFPWIVAIAFGLRLAIIIVAHTYKFKTQNNNFGFGFEMGRIGRSLASGQGFSNPFSAITGPTAWEPPVYPLIIAAVFKVFGIYSKTSAIVLLSINSVFAGLTCIPIFLVAERCFGKIVARGASWAWALFPPIIFWSTRYVWETSLAALLLAIIFWLTLADQESKGLGRLPQWGLLWGITALTNTSLLAFLPVSGLWICYHRRPSVRAMMLAATAFAMCIAPWIARNYQTFGKIIFIRSNFGAELRLGNGPGADGTWMAHLHPTQNAQQLELYRELGEIAYVAQRKQEAASFIREDYSRFATLCAKRFFYYWSAFSSRADDTRSFRPKYFVFPASSLAAFFGLALALKKHRPGAWLFFWLILSYPLIFYIVFPLPRYRHPIEPELGILILYFLIEITKRPRLV